LSTNEATEREQILRLYQLQQIDTRIGNLEREMRQLDDGSTLRTEIATLDQKLAETRSHFKELDTEFHDLDLQLKSVEEKIRRNRDRLFSGTIGNPKELQDLNEEIKVLTVRKGDLEEKLLLMMDELDERRALVEAEERELASRQQRLAEVEKTFAEETERIKAEIASLQTERRSFLGFIDESLLEMYENIRARSANLAVVKLDRDRCPGCSIQVTSYVLNKLKESTEIVRCENCGRIIYWEDEASEASETSADDEDF